MVSPDRAVLNWCGGHRDPALTTVMQSVTDCGRTVPLAIVVALAVSALLVLRRFGQAAMVGFGSVAGYALMVGLKNLVQRPRPPVGDAVAHESSWSFPSGHAMMSIIVFGLIAVVLVWNTGHRWWLLLAGMASLVIGISRLYLGVHWLSDVLAGWLIGAVWVLMLTWVCARWRPSRSG